MPEIPFAARAVLGVLGVCIMVVCLCRARYMSAEGTRPLIRYAVAAQFCAGMLLAMCATARPGWMLAALMMCAAAMLFSQAASAILWSGGQPIEFARQRRGPPAEPISLQSRRLRRWG